MSKSGPQPKQLPHSLRFDFFKGKNKGRQKLWVSSVPQQYSFNDRN